MKVSFNLPNDVLDAAKKLASERNTTVTNVVREAISTEYFLAGEATKGGKVIIRKPDGKMTQLVYPENRVHR